jgi:hypothetical protein
MNSLQKQDIEATLAKSKRKRDQLKMSLILLKERIPTLPKIDEVRERQDKIRVEVAEIEQLSKEADILLSRIRFKKEQPGMLAALQEEEKMRELK